jgi:hypothetical protein
MLNKISALYDLLLEIKQILNDFGNIQLFIQKFDTLFMNQTFESLIKPEKIVLYKNLRYENSNLSNFFIKKGLAFFLEDLQNNSLDRSVEDEDIINKNNINNRISALNKNYEVLQDNLRKLLEQLKEKNKRLFVFSTEELLDLLVKIANPKVLEQIFQKNHKKTLNIKTNYLT